MDKDDKEKMRAASTQLAIKRIKQSATNGKT
jgi:hypothetical protein